MKKRIILILGIILLIICSLAVYVLFIRPDTGLVMEIKSPLRTMGNLSIRDIVFATDDFYFYPETVDAEEGWLRVPENRDIQNSRMITIHFIRFKSINKNHGYPVVYLAGGPGGSGTHSAAGDRYQLFMKMREVGDVIALDQRGAYGTDYYTPCPVSWKYPLDKPANVEVLDGIMKSYLDNCEKQVGDSISIAGYNSKESAEDIDDLRKALGVEKLNLWGISYGTHLAFAYLRYFPDHVNKMVLAGVEGPNDTFKMPSQIDTVLKRINNEILADESARKVMPDFIGSFRSTLKKLKNNPVTVTVTDERTNEKHSVVLGPLDLQLALYSLMGEREHIAEIVKHLYPIFHGDYTDLARLIYRGKSRNRELIMNVAMDCASGVTADRLAEIEKESKTSLIGYAPNFKLMARYSAWSKFDLGDQFRSPISSDVPALFISGTLDAKTPPVNASEIIKGFPNGKQLIIDGASHDDDLFLSSQKIGEEILTFFKTRNTDIDAVHLDPIEFSLP
ncbi:MAG: alpha/beta fold hydrolase [Ignavibacteriaceae bacterium]